MPPNPSWRHHYVPEFYLKRWATDPDGKLWRYSRIEHTGKLDEQRVSPRSTGYEKHLYTVRNWAPFLSETAPDIVETTFFREIDDRAAVAMNLLIEKDENALDDEARTAWATFLSSLIHRAPTLLAERDAIAPAHARETLAALLEDLKKDESRARWIETFNSVDVEAFSLNMVRETMMADIKDPPLVEYFKSLSWTIISFSGIELVTTDTPMLRNFGKYAEPIDTFAMALSPSVLFIAHPHWPLDDDFIDIAKDLAILHNPIHVTSSARTLYSKEKLVDDERALLRTAAFERFGLPKASGSTNR